MLMLLGLVGTGAPALAQGIIPPLPPQVKFISNGKFTGTINVQGITLPFTGSVAYLTGDTAYSKQEIVFNVGGQQITRDSWVVNTPGVIQVWDIVSTDPTTCRTEVLSGGSYPQCTAWSRTPRGIYVSDCTVTVQPIKATFDFAVLLSADNKLVQISETTPITGLTDGITITITSQGTTPPIPSDFNRPSICSAPNVGTIPLPLLLWLL